LSGISKIRHLNKLFMQERYAYLPYLVMASVHLISLYWLPEGGQLATKALLMPALMIPVWRAIMPQGKGLLAAALLFSWLGDLAIGFFFLAGLAAFLLAHLSYIVLFMRLISSGSRQQPYARLLLIAVPAFVVVLLWKLLPNAGTMMLPVFIYALVIGSMLLLSIAGQSHWAPGPAAWVLGGAALFVLSDSVLAWNKFVAPLPFSAAIIMVSYMAAQLALVRGITRLA
jgi:uncharacterized membrane protein YhhN